MCFTFLSPVYTCWELQGMSSSYLWAHNRTGWPCSASALRKVHAARLSSAPDPSSGHSLQRKHQGSSQEMDLPLQITQMIHMEGSHPVSAPGRIFTSPPVKCWCWVKAAVSRTGCVLNFSLAPLPPKGTGVTTLQSESVYLTANQAEHTQAPPRFPIELLQVIPFLCGGGKTYVLDFTGGGCQYNLFLLSYTIYKKGNIGS